MAAVKMIGDRYVCVHVCVRVLFRVCIRVYLCVCVWQKEQKTRDKLMTEVLQGLQKQV